MTGAQGKLSLAFDYDAASAQTRFRTIEQRQPLKVIRAFELPAGGVLVHLHNLSGGVLTGDRLSLDVKLGRAASVQLTSTSATRIYRSRPGGHGAEFTTNMEIQENALLEYLPDPVIPFAGSRYSQRTAVHLSEGAGLFWWETLAPGREARGEVFAYDELRVRFDLSVCGMPVAIENAELKPALRPLTSTARMGGYRYTSSFYICRAGTTETEWSTLERQLLELAVGMSTPVIIWGLARLPAHGLVVRALSRNGRDIARGLIGFWRAAKQALYGQEAVVPRKIY